VAEEIGSFKVLFKKALILVVSNSVIFLDLFKVSNVLFKAAVVWGLIVNPKLVSFSL